MYRPGWCRSSADFVSEIADPYGLPIRACYVGKDAASRLAGFVRSRGVATVHLVADENTFAAGGDDVTHALESEGVSVRHQRFGGAPFDATDTLGDEVAGATDDADLLVAVGAGTICDLVKYAGDKLNRPAVVYPTAASMNGYTSAITALKVRGLKRTIPCRPAIGIFAAPDHVATAPQRMTAAGVGDFLSKCSSATDWRASHRLLDVPFDATARSFFEGIQENLLEAAPRIGQAEPDAVGIVLEALLLSGFSMVVAGSSAPASGGEHLLSHFLDMKSAINGTPHDLHGAQVGVGTVYCLGLWERVLALEPHDVDIDALTNRRPSEPRIASWIEADWGPAIGAEVNAQWKAKRLDARAFRAYLARFREMLPQLRSDLALDMLPAATVEKAIRAAGGPTRPEELRTPLVDYNAALRRARYIRDRFTVLDLAADLGLTSDMVEPS